MSSEIVDAFVQEYKQGLAKHSDKPWHQRKKLAMREAERWIPDARQIIKGAFAPGKSKEDEGAQLMRGMAIAARKQLSLERHAINSVNGHNGNSPATPTVIEAVSTEKPNTEKKSAASIYKSWLETRDFVPSDYTLEYFTGFDTTTWGNTRARLIKEGWVFEKVNGKGWAVTTRPQKAPDSTPKMYSVEEIVEMLSKLGVVAG